MFDAIASAISLMVYLDTALIVLVRRPREAYARVFLVVALTTAVPYAVTFLQWWKGAGVYTPPVIALITAAFCIGSAALFHFTQVFPWRRPWIRAHGRWLVLVYAVPVIPVALAAWTLGVVLSAVQSDAGSGGIGAVSAGISEALILLAGLPVVFFSGVVLPLAGVLSLVKSWREAKAASDEPARKVTFWMLISQLAGGVLAILVLPLLRLAGIPPLWSTVFAGFAYAFALIMPYAFLAARGFGDAGSTPQLHNPATPK
jgi:hypothetical protein